MCRGHGRQRNTWQSRDQYTQQSRDQYTRQSRDQNTWQSRDQNTRQSTRKTVSTVATNYTKTSQREYPAHGKQCHIILCSKYNHFANWCKSVTSVHEVTTERTDYWKVPFALLGKLKVRSMQRSGPDAIRTQIQPSKPKRDIINITNGQNTR